MPSFDEREKGFEAKFSHDQEMEFKVRVRRNKLFGQWAAELLGLEGAAVEAYWKECVESDFEEAGDQDIIGKVMKDFAAAGEEMSERRLGNELERLAEAAREQLRRKEG